MYSDALIKNYDGLIYSLILPDLKDRHVFAAAIKTNTDLIVTHNLKQFPASYLNTFGFSAIIAEDFLTDIKDLNHELTFEAFRI